MRIFSFLTTCLVVLLLAACGGGGGSPGLSSGSVQAFLVLAPTDLTLQVGLAQRYSIQGGVKPYSVFSSNPSVSIGWLADENILSLGAVGGGEATVSVVDAKGTKVEIKVTAGASFKFFSGAPTSLTLAPGAAGSQTFQMGGGTLAYTATSSDTSVATVVVTGTTATITGVRASTSTATITFLDGAGESLSTIVNVATIPLSINPTTVTAFINDTVFARISGGTAPYKVDTGVTDAVAATIANQNEVTIKILRALQTYDLIVVDANGQTAKLTLNATTGTNVFRLTPSELTVSESETQAISLTIYGATGPVSVFSSDTLLLNASVVGNIVTLRRQSGCVAANSSVEVSVIDSIGSIGKATITIQDIGNGSPPAVVGPPPVAAGNCPL